MQHAIKAIGSISSEARASMRAWQIIAASAVVASIAAAALFLPGAARLPGGAASLLRTYWPGAAIFWLAVYSVVALVLTTAATVRDVVSAEAGPGGIDPGGIGPGRMDWARRYLALLA